MSDVLDFPLHGWRRPRNGCSAFLPVSYHVMSALDDDMILDSNVGNELAYSESINNSALPVTIAGEVRTFSRSRIYIVPSSPLEHLCNIF